jgi:hypothetical protein
MSGCGFLAVQPYRSCDAHPRFEANNVNLAASIATWPQPHWTFSDLVPRPRETSYDRGPQTSGPAGGLGYNGAAVLAATAIRPLGCRSDDVGLAGMLTSEAVARSPLRRQVLHRCAQHQDLLPSHMSGAYRARGERPLLSNRRRVGRSRVPSLFALPAGMFAGNPSLVRSVEHGFESSAPDRGK